MSDEPQERFSLRSLLSGPLYQVLSLAIVVAFAAGAIGTLWLLASLMFGHYGEFAALAKDTKLAVLRNISLAQTLATWGFAVGAVLAAILYFGEEVLGYALLGGALLIGLGVPFGFQQFGGDSFAATKSIALSRVYTAFFSSVTVPAIIGAALVAVDVFGRLIRTIRERPTVKVDKMTYGTGAQVENAGRPPRTSILGKCWEGPFCRDFIRPHCPIFLKRQACWQQKRGCYCEEEIVSNAAAKVSGQSLPVMNGGGNSRFANTPAVSNDFNSVPDPSTAGFQVIGAASRVGSALPVTPEPVLNTRPRKVELTAAQKRERCRNCVIYNEHQREKYQLLLPVVVVGTIVLCAFFGIQLHNNATGVVNGIEMIVNRFSFLPGAHTVSVGNSSNAVSWIFLGAFTIMIVSKALQTLEWCVFKLKI